jgi:hypothetical protein
VVVEAQQETLLRLHVHHVLADVITKALPATVLNLDLPHIAGKVARRNAAKLAVALTAARKKAIADIVAMGIENDWPESVVQDRIKATVGLDPRRTRAVENYRQALLKSGVARGKANTMARAYSRRLRAERAQVLAETEGRQAIADAQRELWAEMRRQSLVTPYAVRITQGQNDVRKCPTCRKENGKRRSLKHMDGGPPFHPRCRCWEVLEDKGIVKADLMVKSWDEVKNERTRTSEAA